ncbi:hypothetical protein N9B82_01915 [Saprospiraceae bacterium]|nr:hypothetical protein [Saprospiraceae bacterium]
MKTRTHLTFLFAFSIMTLIGQNQDYKRWEFGINYNPTLSFNANHRRVPAFNSSLGIFTKLKLRPKVALGIGLEYQEQNLNVTRLMDVTGYKDIEAVKIQDQFKVVRTPIWASLDVTYKAKSKFKTDLIGGYALGRLLNANDKEKQYNLHDLIDILHYGFLGVEFHRELYNQCRFTMGTHLEFTNIYDQRYGEISNLKIVLRISKSS